MSKHSDVHHVVAKLLTIPGADAIVQGHRWRHEADREHELVFALLTRVLPLPESEVRALAHRLRFLGLLDLHEWAEVPGADDVVERRTLEVLVESGVEPDDAQRAITVLGEVATALHRDYDGKVQRLLRDFGDQLVTSLVQSFQLESLSNDEAREAFAYWLQNVADLPISLGRDSTKRFCEMHDTSADQLVHAADDFNLNVAALDDLVHHWISAADANRALDDEETADGKR